MRTIQVNEDLRKPGRDYQPVYEYIKGPPGVVPLAGLLLADPHREDGRRRSR